MQGTPQRPGGELHALDGEEDGEGDGEGEGAALWGNLLVMELEPQEPVPPPHTPLIGSLFVNSAGGGFSFSVMGLTAFVG